MNYHWVNLSYWITLTPAKRADLEAWIKAQGGTLAIDINDSSDLPKNEMLGEFEEYVGEADSRGLDPRGFNK